jgi:hypothetical protein
MNRHLNLTSLGSVLKHSMDTIEEHDSREKVAEESTPTYRATNIGNVISSAYEQLRNASEYAEDHLLLQRAAKRYFRRNLHFYKDQRQPMLAEELTIELTLSGYLKNGSVSLADITKIDSLVAEFYSAYKSIGKNHGTPKESTVRDWVIELLSVRSEQVYNSPVRIMYFAHFAHTYYSDKIDPAQFLTNNEQIRPEAFPIAVYIAVHRALLKSDDANIRSLLLDIYQIKPSSTTEFINFNLQCDELFKLKTVDRITRFISKNGAHMRIARAVFFDKATAVTAQALTNRPSIISAINHRIEEHYKTTSSKLRSGIIKSVLFLLITKAVIGVAVEVPYDILTTGTVEIIPLIINLLLPAIFIASSTITLRMPSSSNTGTITDAIDEIIYDLQERPTTNYKFKTPTLNKQPFIFNLIYAAMFIICMGLMIQLLSMVGFNLLQGIIFAIFISTAAFLGYQLSLRIKDLEIIQSNQSFATLIRDFIYTPFIIVGRQISYRYAQINIISQLLDTVIELPLKTILRLLRQWSNFLSAKKEEIL